jgi:hypothetical protein
MTYITQKHALHIEFPTEQALNVFLKNIESYHDLCLSEDISDEEWEDVRCTTFF